MSAASGGESRAGRRTPRPPARGGRAGAAVALLVLGTALVLAVALTTPWDPLAGSATSPVTPHRDFTVAEVAREDAFHAAVRPPAYASLLAGLLMSLVLGLTPLGSHLITRLAAPFGGGWATRVLAGALGVTLLTAAARLPFDARAELALRRYGLSTQTWASWAGDAARSFTLSAGLLILALGAAYAAIRRWPRGWWAPVALGGAALVVAVSFVFPVVVEPAFNRFAPVPAGPMRSALLELAARDAVPVRDILVADASRRTTALNAYVSGFGSTRRLVVYDTLLQGATADEARLIVAHELGHAKRGDVLLGTLLGALATAAAVCLLALLLAVPGLLRRAGVADLGDPRSLALVLALVTVLTTVGGPLQLLVSRAIEARADVHALELTRDPASFAAMQRRLAVRNLSDVDPAPLVRLLFATHPTAPERIALARSWSRRAGLPEPPGLAP